MAHANQPSAERPRLRPQGNRTKWPILPRTSWSAPARTRWRSTPRPSQRGCRGADVTTARHLCRAELDRFQAAMRRRRAAHRRLHAGGAAVRRGGGRGRTHSSASPSSISAKPPAGRATGARPGRRWPPCWLPRRSPCRLCRWSVWRAKASSSSTAATSAPIEAANLLKDHLDVTVLLKPPAAIAPPRSTEFPDRAGHDPGRQGTPRRIRAHGRRLRRCLRRPRAARWCSGRRATARNRTATSSSTCPAVRRCSLRRPARRLFARRPGRSGGRAQGRARGARSGRHVRQAALHHLRCRPLRAFALAHRRLQPLPRPLPDRGHHAGRQSCRDRRRRSAPAAASAPRSARPAPPPMRCRRPTR